MMPPELPPALRTFTYPCRQSTASPPNCKGVVGSPAFRRKLRDKNRLKPELRTTLQWARQDFLAMVLWAEGPAVRPAQGTTLGERGQSCVLVGPTGQKFTERLARWADNTVWLGVSPQGGALGWANHAPSEQSECCQEILPRPFQVSWAGGLARIIPGAGGTYARCAILTRIASEGNAFCRPRLRFGLVWSHE